MFGLSLLLGRLLFKGIVRAVIMHAQSAGCHILVLLFLCHLLFFLQKQTRVLQLRRHARLGVQRIQFQIDAVQLLTHNLQGFALRFAITTAHELRLKLIQPQEHLLCFWRRCRVAVPI